MAHTETETDALVIAAHPDDETIGCGGMIARLVAEGHGVSVLVLTRCSIQSRYAIPLDAATARRRAEFALALRRLGVSSPPAFAEFDEIGLATTPQDRIAGAIERMISVMQPSLVLTHSDGDLNQDHRAAHMATMVAARPSHGVVKRVLCYSSDPVPWRALPHARGCVFVDVSNHLAAKMDAAMAYTSELRPHPSPRSLEFIEALARLHGAMIGRAAAEVFEVAWEID